VPLLRRLAVCVILVQKLSCTGIEGLSFGFVTCEASNVYYQNVHMFHLKKSNFHIVAW